MKKIFITLTAILLATFGLVLSGPEVFAYNFVTTLEYQSEPDADWIEVQTTKIQIYQEEPGTDSGYLTVDFDSVSTSIDDINNHANFSIRFPEITTLEYQSEPGADWIKVQTTKIQIYQEEPGTDSGYLTVDFDSVSTSIDDINNHANFSIRFVPDNKRPAINGEENFITNVNDSKSVEFFQAFLSAYDETDGDLTDQIYIVTDNYTANKSVLGTHKVVFGVKDSSGNESTLEVYIRVVDIDKPVITGNSNIVEVGYKETWNISNFQSTLQVSDNYDVLANSDIYVKTDNYTTNKTKLGTYEVVFGVKDSSGNEGTFIKKIKVIDNIKPTFSGPTTIATNNNTILTESDIRAQITAQDDIDGNLTNKIVVLEDNYTGYGNKVGTYTITYKVTDNAGNSATHTVTIQRSDKIPPVFWIQDGVSIRTTPTTPLDINQIIQILEATGQLTVTSTTQFNVLLNEYEGNETTPGIYALSIKARAANGNESIHNLSINVLDIQDDEPITKTPDQSIINWVKDNPAWTTVIVLSIIMIPLVLKRKKK